MWSPIAEHIFDSSPYPWWWSSCPFPKWQEEQIDSVSLRLGFNSDHFRWHMLFNCMNIYIGVVNWIQCSRLKVNSLDYFLHVISFPGIFFFRNHSINILFYFYFYFLVAFVLIHDYTLYFTGSPCCKFSYYNYISIWPYYIVIHLINDHIQWSSLFTYSETI